MRIAYMLTSLGAGGAERQAVMLAERMAARGHDVMIVALRAPGAAEWPTHLPVMHLGMTYSPATVLKALRNARRTLIAFSPGLIHSHNFHGNTCARGLKCLLPHVRVVSTIHNVYEGGAVRTLAYRLSDWLSELSVAVSDAVKASAVSTGKVPKRKCRVIANGFDTREFAPDQARRKAMRAELDAQDSFVWLAVGRLSPAKDYANVLRAFARVRQDRPGARLWIAGDGDPDYSAALRELSAQLGLTMFVKWLGMRRDVPALLDAADGFVLGSAWEGMPLALGEAMCMQKAVVATDVGGVRELLGNAGKVVAARDPDQLAEAMLAAMRLQPEEREAAGQAARQRVVSLFPMDGTVAQWESVYRACIEGRTSIEAGGVPAQDAPEGKSLLRN